MSTHHTRSEQYQRVREAFDSLGVTDRATFLLEATAATLAHGLEEAGRAVADELDNFFRAAAAATEEQPPPPGPEVTEPPAPPPAGENGT
jgi:hypothetical protein